MKTGSKRNGFTAVELMIVLEIIMILVVIALPNFLRYRMNANETSAVASIKLLAMSEAAFKASSFFDADGDGEGDYGTLEELANPDGRGETPPFIDADLAKGDKSGYGFIIAITTGSPGTSPSYSCIGFPESPTYTGIRIFYVDESAVIRYTKDGTAVGPTSDPIS